MKNQKTEKKCKGYSDNPCKEILSTQSIKNFPGRSAVCRTCLNAAKRQKRKDKKKNKAFDRRQPTPKFITLTSLVMSRLWTDPVLKKVSDELINSPS